MGIFRRIEQAPLEIARLEAQLAPHKDALPPTVSARLALFRVVTGVVKLTLPLSISLGGVIGLVLVVRLGLPRGLSLPAFVLGAVGALFAALGAQLGLQLSALRLTVRSLEQAEAARAVSGSTPAALPATFSGARAEPLPPPQDAHGRSVGVGDEDALDA